MITIKDLMSQINPWCNFIDLNRILAEMNLDH